MNSILDFLFYPNPGYAFYSSPKAFTLLTACFLLVLSSFALSWYRRRMSDPMLKKLSSPWPTGCFWFGAIGCILVVSRVENIAYLAMRFWWIVWVVALIAFVYAQYRIFRMKYYKKIASESRTPDARDKYLPKKRKK